MSMKDTAEGYGGGILIVMGYNVLFFRKNLSYFVRSLKKFK